MTLSLSLLAVLFVLSGFFSASETALFSLRREDRVWLEARGTRSSHCVLELLSSPRSLLVAVLFGNLLVNFLLFAVSARLALQVSPDASGATVVGVGLLTTVSVLLAGEVVPKAVAVTIPRRISLIAGPLLLAFRTGTRVLTTPLAAIAERFLDLVERRLPAPAGALTDQELRRFVELHGEEGAIERQASEFLAEALELGSRRAHEVVTPRVDLVAISEGADRDAFLALVRERRVGTILVHKGDVDQIHGYVRIKDLVRRSELTPKELVRPIWYVPRTKSLESLLREMIERREQLALVVGEYGGTDGLVTLEDVVEEITGDIAQQDAWPLVRGGGEEGVWVMAGRLPLREAGELLGLRFDPGPTTLGGFLAQELGRLPEEGDVVWRARVQFRVGSVERRRARDVVVSLPGAGRVVAARRSNEVSQAMTRSGAMRAERRLTDWVADAPEPEPNTDAEPKA